MNMRHLFVLLIITTVLILSYTGCSDDTEETDPYGIKGLTEAMEQYNKALSGVETVEDYTKAMENYTKKINELKPKVEKLLQEVPQLFQKQELKKLPKEINKEDIEKLFYAMERNMEISLNKYKAEYMENEDFSEAMSDMQEANSILF